MWRLINVTKGVTEARVIQFWYGILEKDLKQGVWNIFITQLTQPTMALVFQVFERIELNMVDEKVVTLRFSRETLKSSPTSIQ
jgi:hypothetical protein